MYFNCGVYSDFLLCMDVEWSREQMLHLVQQQVLRKCFWNVMAYVYKNKNKCAWKKVLSREELMYTLLKKLSLLRLNIGMKEENGCRLEVCKWH